VYVKYKCNCVEDTTSLPALALRCRQHGSEIKDWSSDYQSPYRVVIHWRAEGAEFALHKVEYDQNGFTCKMSMEGITPRYHTTAELARETRSMGLNMEEVSNIFYDRYLEYREFYPEETPDEEA
jgi:hypothetical protein